MTDINSGPSQDIVFALSLREVERGVHLANGWDSHHNQPTDFLATFSDADFRLGLDAPQTTLGVLAE